MYLFIGQSEGGRGLCSGYTLTQEGGRDPSTGLSWVMLVGLFYMELVRETTLVVYGIVL